MKSENLQFTKMTAAGNDFVLMSGKSISHKQEERSRLAVKLCDRHFGVGADGFVVVDVSKNPKAAQFAWDFYNADGTSADMCGNAARCVARFARGIGAVTTANMNFETAVGVVNAVINQDQSVTVKMPGFRELAKKKKVVVGSTTVVGDWIDAGVPHFVVESTMTMAQLKELGSQLRHHEDLGPAGANVSFYNRIGGEMVGGFTFERGVEDFTLACGTGAIAIAVSLTEGIKSTHKIVMPGGTLVVNVEGAQVFLSGDAKYVFEGTLDTEALV